MRRLLIATALCLAASPALALRVTNLDRVPHTITYEVGGQVLTRQLAPNETARFDGMPNGRLSLASSPAPREGGALNADGLLSGIVGNGRDQRIPVDMMDDYAIWPDGRLQLQRRMKRYGYH